MSVKDYLILPFVFLLFSPMLAAQDVVINEVMSSNASAWHDEDGDFEDWIELYNPGPEAAGLNGYGLSDDYDDPFKWTFPDVVIEPEGYLLVWASGKNRKEGNQPLHTSFRITQAGEELLLTHSDGKRLDGLAPVFIPTDVSYGRQPDGSADWYYFTEPTPAETNITEGFSELLSPPAYSKMSGFYNEEFELKISHEDPDVTIVYTLDGSAPGLENLDGTTYYYKNSYPQNPGDPFGELIPASFRSMIYDGEISVYDRSAEPDRLTGISSTWHAKPDYFPDNPVFKGTVVRAIALKDGAMESPEQSAVFFVSEKGEDRYTLPVVSLLTDESHLFDYEEGIYVAGVDFDNWRLNNPATDYPYAVYNAMRRGESWEYPAHFIFMDKGGEVLIDQGIGFRIHGGWTRSYPAKSLRLYARNKYSRSHFEHQIFDDTGFNSYKRLLLRNSGQDWKWTMFRDAAIQRMVRDMNIETQAYRPAILFINGEYWGIKNLRERYDKHYLARVYGVDEESVDILELEGKVVEGDNLHYNSMLDYMDEHSMADSIHYGYICTQMDVDNFIDYQIANIFASNTDWPNRNVTYWRTRTDQYIPDASRGQDGRWRWLLYDTDAGFGSWSHVGFNMLEYSADPVHDWGSRIIRELLDSRVFRTAFINRYADLLNTAFLPDRTIGIIKEMKQAIEPEIKEHIARWGSPASKDDWKHFIGEMLDFALLRPGFQRDHIVDFFDLDGQIDVTLDVNNQLMGYIRINSIEIKHGTPGISETPYPWRGRYFRGVPVVAEAIAAPGYRFSHWGEDNMQDDNLITLEAEGNIHLVAHFERCDEPVLLHYWMFDTGMPNNTPLEELFSTYSALSESKIEFRSSLEGYPYYEGHPLWRKASMERRNSPTGINYRQAGNNDIPYHESEMRGLQLRQPFADSGRENTMILHLPAKGFSDIVLKFAAQDEGAADRLVIDYQTCGDCSDWADIGISAQDFWLDEEYRLFTVDFSNVEEVENNAHFKVRIRFDGKEMSEDEGRRVTFNNISLEGRSLNAHNIFASAGPNGSISPSGRIPVYSDTSVKFEIVPDQGYRIDKFWVDGMNIVDSLNFRDDGSADYVFHKVGETHDVHAGFFLDWGDAENDENNVVISPNPARDEVNIASQEVVHGIVIVSLSGQVVYRNDSVNDLKHSIDTSALKQGFFILLIQTEKGPVTRKLQVIH